MIIIAIITITIIINISSMRAEIIVCFVHSYIPQLLEYTWHKVDVSYLLNKPLFNG